MRSWDAFLQACEESNFTLKELADLGRDEVFAGTEMTIKWKGSGMGLTEPRFGVLTVRDGLIVGVNVYRDRSEALEAAGPSE